MRTIASVETMEEVQEKHMPSMLEWARNNEMGTGGSSFWRLCRIVP